MATPAWDRARPRKRAAVLLAAGAAMTALASPPDASAAEREAWEYDWVAVTVAQNGAWGVATNASVMRAMVQAIGDCRRRAGPVSNDCGGEITTVRASWSLAYACGDYSFISNGDTPADARVAAIARAIDLREIIGLELPPCQLLVAIGSDGRTEPKDGKKEFLSLPRSGR